MSMGLFVSGRRDNPDIFKTSGIPKCSVRQIETLNKKNKRKRSCVLAKEIRFGTNEALIRL